MTTKFHDKNVSAVANKLQARADKGLATYGTNTERDDYNFLDWLRELQEELMDAVVYVEASMGAINEGPRHCPQCNYLQNKIDRHECRQGQSMMNIGTLQFYQYLQNFDLVDHFERWCITSLELDSEVDV